MVDYAAVNYASALDNAPSNKDPEAAERIRGKAAAAEALRPAQVAKALERAGPQRSYLDTRLECSANPDYYKAFGCMLEYVANRGYELANTPGAQPPSSDLAFLDRLDSVTRIWEAQARREALPGLAVSGLFACQELARKAAKDAPAGDALVAQVKQRCVGVQQVAEGTLRASVETPNRRPLAKAARRALLALLANKDDDWAAYRTSLLVAQQTYAPVIQLQLSGAEGCADGARDLIAALKAGSAQGQAAFSGSGTLRSCGPSQSVYTDETPQSKTVVEMQEVTEYEVEGYAPRQVCGPAWESTLYGPAGSLTATVTTHQSCTTESAPIYRAVLVTRPVERTHNWVARSDVTTVRYTFTGELQLPSGGFPFSVGSSRGSSVPSGQVADAARLDTLRTVVRDEAVSEAATAIQAAIGAEAWKIAEDRLVSEARTDPAALEELMALYLLQGRSPSLKGNEAARMSLGFAAARLPGARPDDPATIKFYLMNTAPGDATPESAAVIAGLVDPVALPALGLVGWKP
jgi:hypothetical protein